MNASTEFRDPRAVDAWDSCFRLRDHSGLLDVTVDATWQRVASALQGAAGSEHAWTARYLDAFAHWRILPDERLLRFAGTGLPMGSSEPPAAVLNVAAFVGCDALALAIDRSALREAAALSVRMLDDAACLFGAQADSLRIGVIGTADALAKLGLDYDSDAARTAMALIVATIAEGCLRASVSLARERGARFEVDDDLHRRWRRRGVEPGLIADAQRSGLRFRDVTAIDPHPPLAAFANGVGDGLEPSGSVPPVEGAGSGARRARAAMRAAVQPWIDAVIAD
jgi:ribonucleoside-diphosphate reductase alpha chain